MGLLTGKMPNFAYKCMIFVMNTMDFFHRPGKVLDSFNIQNGQRVLDLGCGPGRYLQIASKLVGETGQVFAADIHPLAIEKVKQQIRQCYLQNIIPVILPDEFIKIKENTVDIVYALDMFHHVTNAKKFLDPIHPLLKKNGRFYLEDGHQSRAVTKRKVKQSDLWEIVGETSRYIILTPK